MFSYFFILFWSDTDEELNEWKTKFEERIALLESKISKLEREMNDTDTKSSFLKQTVNEYIWEISKLQTEAEVSETVHILTVKKPYKFMWIIFLIISFAFGFRLICP